MSHKLTTLHWSDLDKGFRQGVLAGILHEGEHIHKLVFVTPEGAKIEVPLGSEIELHIDLDTEIYAVGIEHRPGEFGMTHGPNPNLGAMLEVYPPDPKAKIICFAKDGSEERITHRARYLPKRDGLEWVAVEIDPAEVDHTEAR